MATEEYLKKLNKALPVGDYDEEPTMNGLRAHGIRCLIRKKEPPAIADPSAPTINVIVDSDYCSAFHEMNLFQVENLNGSRWNSNICMAYFNDVLELMGVDIPNSEIHYIWRYTATEAKIHLGEANIDRAIYDMSVQMNIRKMKEGLLLRVFCDHCFAEENDVLFGDPNDEESYYKVTVPTEVNEDLVWKQYEEEKSKLNRSDFDDRETYDEKVKSFFHNAKRRVLLPTLKSRLLQNVKKMLSREGLVSKQESSNNNDSQFLALPIEIQTKILLYLHEPGSKWRNPMECQKIMIFASFGLASKSCYKIFCNAIHSIKENTDIDDNGGEKVVRFHNFNDLFNGMTIQDIALAFDELVWHGGDCGCFFCPDSHIEICKSYFYEDKLEIGDTGESWCG